MIIHLLPLTAPPLLLLLQSTASAAAIINQSKTYLTCRYVRSKTNRSQQCLSHKKQKLKKLEGTHRVGTHAVLLLSVIFAFNSQYCEKCTYWHWDPDFDGASQNHITCRISQDHSLYQVWTLWNHSFFSYAAVNRQADRQTNKRPRTPYPRPPTWIAKYLLLFMQINCYCYCGCYNEKGRPTCK